MLNKLDSSLVIYRLPWWFKWERICLQWRVPGLIPDSEDLLEKGMATSASILAWRIHGQRSLVGPSPWCHKESDTTEWLTFSPLLIYILSSFPPQCLIYQSHFSGICLVSLTENSIPFFLSVLFIFTFLCLTAQCFENSKYSANACWIKITMENMF